MRDRYESTIPGAGTPVGTLDPADYPMEQRYVDTDAGVEYIVFDLGSGKEWLQLSGGSFAPTPHNHDHHIGQLSAGSFGTGLPNAQAFPTGTGWKTEHFNGVSMDGTAVKLRKIHVYANGGAPTANIGIAFKLGGVSIGTATIVAGQTHGEIDLTSAPETLTDSSVMTIDMPEDVKEAKGFEWVYEVTREVAA